MEKQNTLCILYAEKDKIAAFAKSNTITCNKVKLDMCFVFKASLDNVQEQASLLLNDQDRMARDEISICFNCREPKEELMRCSVCKLAKYCSKVDKV